MSLCLRSHIAHSPLCTSTSILKLKYKPRLTCTCHVKQWSTPPSMYGGGIAIVFQKPQRKTWVEKILFIDSDNPSYCQSRVSQILWLQTTLSIVLGEWSHKTLYPEQKISFIQIWYHTIVFVYLEVVPPGLRISCM